METTAPNKYPPPHEFAARARIRSPDEYAALYRRSLEDPTGFWRDQASALTWFHPPSSIVDADAPGEFVWFSGKQI